MLTLLRNFVNIIGIADPSTFPVIGTGSEYKQFSVSEMLTIPAEKPDIEQINTVMAEATIDSYRTIATPTGLKVIINGTLIQKAIYTSAEDPAQPVHSAEINVQFCNFIDIPLTLAPNQSALDLLQTLGLTLDTALAVPPAIIIEDLSVTQVDARRIKKCAILFAYVTVNTLLVPFLA